MLRLTRLRLQQFRNYQRLDWNLGLDAAPRIMVLTGPNGSGKTNLLEAISLLGPGRGLRGARIADFPRRGSGPSASWGIAARLEGPQGSFDLGTGGAGQSADRREFQLNGAPPRSQAELAARVGLVWLTPQMDRLFQEPPSGRRRFLDRLVSALEPAHAQRLAAHDNAQAQRMRLLAAQRFDPGWVGSLEDGVARHAVAVAASRLALCGRLNQTLRDGAVPGFPAATITLLCPIAARLQESSALATEDWLRASLAQARDQDGRTGSAQFGAQRADMMLADHATGRSADLSSTGECKALLLGVILGHSMLIGSARGTPPIVLLDEPMVHLDTARRALLAGAAGGIAAQIFLTGTDPDSFAALHGIAGFACTDDGTLQV